LTAGDRKQALEVRGATSPRPRGASYPSTCTWRRWDLSFPCWSRSDKTTIRSSAAAPKGPMS